MIFEVPGYVLATGFGSLMFLLGSMTVLLTAMSTKLEKMEKTINNGLISRIQMLEQRVVLIEANCVREHPNAH